MGAVAFDTLKFSKRLVEAGFTDRQAEALAEEQAALIDDRLATKQDIADVRRDIREFEQCVIIRLSSMMVVAVGVVAALVKPLNIIYNILKNGWIFEDFPAFKLARETIPAGQESLGGGNKHGSTVCHMCIRIKTRS